MTISIKVANEWLEYAAKNSFASFHEACIRLVPMDNWTKSYLSGVSICHSDVEFLMIAAKKLNCRFAVFAAEDNGKYVIVHIIGENRTNTIPLFLTEAKIIHLCGKNNVLRTGKYECRGLAMELYKIDIRAKFPREPSGIYRKCALKKNAAKYAQPISAI